MPVGLSHFVEECEIKFKQLQNECSPRAINNRQTVVATKVE